MNYKELQEPLVLKEYVTFRNLTGRYLVPQIKLLSSEFLSAFPKTSWLAFGIADRNYDKYSEFDNKLFMLTSIKSNLDYIYSIDY